MKRRIISLITAAILTSFVSTVVYAAGVEIIIDGNKIESDTEPQITEEGRTIVPLRVISEALGADVDWDAEDKKVTVEKDDKTLVLKIGENVMDNNGTDFELDSPAQIVNERTMLPLRAISEVFGCEVSWDAETKTVTVNTDTKEETDVVSPALKNEDIYKDVIEGLQEGQYYAFADMGENNDALLVAENAYKDENDNYITNEASVYFVDGDGKPVKIGEVVSGSTAYPLGVFEKNIYYATHHLIGKKAVDEENMALVVSDETYIEFDSDGNETYYDMTNDGEKQVTDDTHYTNLLEEYGKSDIVVFTKVD